MKLTLTTLVSIGLVGLSGCAGSMKLQNVAGTWSCDRVDGVCADISAIDEGTIGPKFEAGHVGGLDAVSAKSAAGQIAVSTQATTVMPSRTPDEVARIVLASNLDAQGRYHSSRVFFAVMKSGDWDAGSAPAEVQTSPTLVADNSSEIQSSSVRRKSGFVPEEADLSNSELDPVLKTQIDRVLTSADAGRTDGK